MNVNRESKKIRVMIVEDEEKVRMSILEFISKETDIDICAFFTSGFDIISEIKFYNPDVVITDFLATDVSGLKVLQVINSMKGKEKPKIIVTSYTDSASVLEESFKLGIDYYIKKPIILSLLNDAIFLVCKDNSENISCGTSLKIRIKSLLKSVGVPSNILGYAYMEDALNYMINSSKIIFLNEIYGKVSDAYDTSVKCVEVSVRNAIKKAQKNNNCEFRKNFSFCECNPSNSVFLSTLKEKLMIEEINL